MRALINTYPVAMDCPGGGEIQLRKTWQYLKALGVDARLYDQWNPEVGAADVVHYFSVQGGSYAFVDYVVRCGIPLVLSPIIWLGDDVSRYPMEEIGHLLGQAAVICPNSEAEIKRIREFFDIDSNRFQVVFNGIDPGYGADAIPGLFTRKHGLPEEYILCVGNIEERKNQHRLIEAARGLDVPVVLAGNIRDGAYMEKCLGAWKEGVIYVGYLGPDSVQLKSAYASCSLFALPSLLETPGLAALEAAACGARVLITEVGATREYFEGYVEYVNPLDVDDIREKIERQLSSPGKDGELQNHVLGNFTWEVAARQTRDAYVKALVS